MAKRVVILGGGVAGLSAAHELVERGFDVVVYEKHLVPGGKARSYSKPHTGVEGRRDLPAEHGFRFFPGFYRHLPDTMTRIPFPNQTNGVFDNLVEAPRMMLARQGAPAVVLPAQFPQSFDDLVTAVRGFLRTNQLPIPLAERLFFLNRLLLMASSCQQRLFEEYEYQSWWEFIGAAQRSAAYRQFLAIGATRSLVACRAEEISARTGGTVLLRLLFGLSTPGVRVDRLLNGPTNEVWIRPWLEYLRKRGVQYLHPMEVQHLHVHGDAITGVTVLNRTNGSVETVSADYYVAAMPIEAVLPLITDAMCRADPRLARLRELKTAWMNGIQFYLRQDVPVVAGHSLYIDSPWALTSVSQQQFWRNSVAQDYGDGTVGGVLSVDVSNWHAPGIVFDKAARECTRDEIKEEVWAQLKAHLNVGGATVLADDNLAAFNLDRDITQHRCVAGQHTMDCVDREPLLLNTKGSWQCRPDAVTRIPNLFLAADYVRTYTDLATMEGANEAARRAVNGILHASGSTASKCALWPVREPAIFTPLREMDQVVYASQTAHPLDRPLTALLKDGAAHLRKRTAQLPGIGMFESIVGALRKAGEMLGAPPAPQRLTVPAPRHVRPAPRPRGRVKVAILGGGMGSIATAYQLTSTPELRAQYEVTVYQQGWRIGGKGASGRNPQQHNRIEEHGVHVWFGFYDNAFRLMRQCYEELGRPPAAPLATLADAFKPCSNMVLYEHYNGRWISWPFTLPENQLAPGEPGALPAFWDIVHSAVGWLWEYWSALRPKWEARVRAAAPQAGGVGGWIHRLAAEIEVTLDTIEDFGAAVMLELACKLAVAKQADGGASGGRHSSLLGDLLEGFRKWLWSTVAHDMEDDDLRLFFTTLDLATSIVRGLIDDDVVGRGFDSLDDKELSEWLADHGAQPLTLETNPILRCLYDVTFAYKNGDIDARDVAAGVSVSVMLRLLFGYKGAFCFKMQAGMGDTVFTPFYEVLTRRGVRFEFFHCVSKLQLSDDKHSVAAVEIIPQVRVLGDAYDPVVDVNGLACWPSEPRWDQLEDGARLQREGVNFEVEPNPLGRAPRTLRKGKEFHLVVLGISVAALPSICGELMADRGNPAFAAMVENSFTTMTEAFQLWLNQPVDELGWEYDPGAIVSAYVEPLDTLCGMDQLIPREAWPEEAKVRSIVYFCSAMRDEPGDTYARTQARAKADALRYLREHVRPVWPNALQPRTAAFDWTLLVDLSEQRGAKRFGSQFWRANFPPTERYVLSPAKYIRYRLRTDESGYDNLYLTGDWINNGGLKGGCIESATISGLQAARAITGTDEPIVGEDANWLVEHRPSTAGGNTSGRRRSRKKRQSTEAHGPNA